jgi:hypothetical protein
MEQTAVEWLAEQYNIVDTAEYEQAKEMEKQQKGYSEKDMREAFYANEDTDIGAEYLPFNKWFEQFKKK